MTLLYIVLMLYLKVMEFYLADDVDLLLSLCLQLGGAFMGGLVQLLEHNLMLLLIIV